MAGRKGRKRPYQLVDDIVGVGAKRLALTGMGMEQAKELMREIAHEVCFLNAKQLIYVPEDLEFELTKRDQAIWSGYQADGPDGARKFTNARAEQLAVEFKLSEVQIYNIIRLMKRREVADRQGVLPGLEPIQAE